MQCGVARVAFTNDPPVLLINQPGLRIEIGDAIAKLDSIASRLTVASSSTSGINASILAMTESDLAR